MKVTEQITMSSHHSAPELMGDRSCSADGAPGLLIWDPGNSGRAAGALSGAKIEMVSVYTKLDISESSINDSVDALILDCGSDPVIFQTCLQRIRKMRNLDRVPVIAFLEDSSVVNLLDEVDEVLFAHTDAQETEMRIERVVKGFRRKMRSGSIESYKRNLVEAIAHDVRSPLHTVSFALDLILESAEKEESRWVKMIRAAKDSTGQITDIMDMMLSIQRLEESGGDVALADVDLSDLMAQVTSSLESPENLSVSVSTGTMVRADLNLSARAIEKVIKNCLHYVPMGEGKVEVSAVSENGQVVVFIEENSKPLPGHFLEGVFDMFARVPEEDGKPGRSFGLDFAYSRAAMYGQGGSLKAINMEKGNVFLAAFAVPE